MSILNKMFGSKDKGELAETPPCPHTALVPRWDSVDDIGHDDRATHYWCEACYETFTPDEAQLLRETAAERMPIGSP